MKYFSIFLVFLFLMPTFGYASDLTLFGGFHRPGKITLGETLDGVYAARPLLTDPKNFGVFGGRFFYSNTPIGIEYTVAYSPSFLEERANALIYNANLRANLLPGPFSPYVTAGVGGIRAGGQGPGSFGNKLTFNYGGGVRLGLIGPLSGRVDVRGYSVRGVESQSLNVIEVSFGIVFAF